MVFEEVRKRESEKTRRGENVRVRGRREKLRLRRKRTWGSEVVLRGVWMWVKLDEIAEV
jgi:hypothetical protein